MRFQNDASLGPATSSGQTGGSPQWISRRNEMTAAVGRRHKKAAGAEAPTA
jgi:hypothetical protein